MKYRFIKKVGRDFREPIVDEPFRLFGDWLSSDVQTSSSVDLVIAQIYNVKKGVVKEIHSDGNAFVALIKSEGVIIWNMYTDERTKSLAGHNEVLELLKSWGAEVPEDK